MSVRVCVLVIRWGCQKPCPGARSRKEEERARAVSWVCNDYFALHSAANAARGVHGPWSVSSGCVAMATATPIAQMNAPATLLTARFRTLASTLATASRVYMPPHTNAAHPQTMPRGHHGQDSTHPGTGDIMPTSDGVSAAIVLGAAPRPNVLCVRCRCALRVVCSVLRTML